MAIELRQQLKLTQQLVMTPQLQMAIRLLQLSRLELLDTIHQELEENPALEEIQDEYVSEEMTEKPVENSDNNEVTIEEKINDKIDWNDYLDEYNSPGRVHFENEEKNEVRYESFVAQRESLTDHLLWQLIMTSPSDEDKEIGSLIIGNLNGDGYLETSLEELSEASGKDVKKVESVLSLLQTFNPIGICARNLEECLMIQSQYFGLNNTIVTDIIKHHLRHIENRNLNAIAKALKINIEDVLSAVNVIRGLEPKPGRSFSDENPQYIEPDIFVYRFEKDFVIVLNEDGMPKLRLNSFYQNSAGKLSDSAKVYMQEKLRSAAWLIRSIHQRQKTIYRVMESILKFQRDFFEKGIDHLKPMVLRDVARDINMHESTISRVTTNKYAYTPQGIFELKFFFNSSIHRTGGEDIASVSVQERMKQIIENENNKLPLSDDKIAAILNQSNINIARRTVAKYREIMGILPSNKRKQF